MTSPRHSCDLGSDFQIVDAISTIERAGCCVLREVVSIEGLAQLKESALAIYKEMDERHRSGVLTAQEKNHCYRYGILRPFEREYRLPNGQLIRDYMLQCITQSKLVQLLREYLGQQLRLLIPSSHIRRQLPFTEQENHCLEQRPVPYHQDSSVMGLRDTTLLNFWFPMDIAGEGAPTVELIPVAQKCILPFGENSDPMRLYSHLEISTETLSQLGDYRTWTPVIRPGDVLVIQSRNVHRTQQSREVCKGRLDFELRFCRSDEIEKRTDIATLPFSP
jgi:hypothetical protein